MIVNNKVNTSLDFFDDDSMVGNRSVPLKLPNVGRPVSSINKPNGSMKLKPVVSKNPLPPKEIMAKRPIITKKLAPVAISPQSNPPLITRTSKSVTNFASRPSDVRERVMSPKGNTNDNQKIQVNWKKSLEVLQFFKLSTII